MTTKGHASGPPTLVEHWATIWYPFFDPIGLAFKLIFLLARAWAKFGGEWPDGLGPESANICPGTQFHDTTFPPFAVDVKNI